MPVTILPELTESHPLFSIITVTYNDLAGLKLTRESVAGQSCSDFHWVVVDGASSDGTVDFLSRVGDGKLMWLSEKDSGIYDAMNKGMNLARGDFIVFLNAGDIFPDSMTLAKVKDFLSSLPAVPDLVFGGATLALPNGRKSYRSPRKMERYIWHGLPANHQATYYRRACLGDIRYDTTYRICGDYYLVAVLYLKGGKAAYLDEPLVDFRVGDTSYRNPSLLFWEPYAIQRDVLKLSFATRLRSLVKRLISTLGLVILSQKWFARR